MQDPVCVPDQRNDIENDDVMTPHEVCDQSRYLKERKASYVHLFQKVYLILQILLDNFTILTTILTGALLVVCWVGKNGTDGDGEG